MKSETNNSLIIVCKRYDDAILQSENENGCIYKLLLSISQGTDEQERDS